MLAPSAFATPMAHSFRPRTLPHCLLALSLLVPAGCGQSGSATRTAASTTAHAAPTNATTDANSNTARDSAPTTTLSVADPLPSGQAPSDPNNSNKTTPANAANKPATPQLETVTLGAGCFWCIEAVLLRLKGVEAVQSGYMGGKIAKPTYEMVCTGRTGHAEVVQLKFDPQVLPFDKLLDIFFQAHDPTTLNRQGFDVGTQYRSAIFYHTETQKQIAEASLKHWNESGKFTDPIVTEISPASEFYVAEGYHQDYFNKNPGNPYCRANILPKFKKLGLLKDDE